MDHDEAQRVAAGWLHSWNRRDLDGILVHYADDVQFASPVARDLGASADGTIAGIDGLRRYFSEALARSEDLAFDPVATLAGVGGLTVLYRNHRGQLVAETMLHAAGKIGTVHVHYAPVEAVT